MVNLKILIISGLTLLALPLFASADAKPAPALAVTCSNADGSFGYRAYEVFGFGKDAYVKITGNTGNAGAEEAPATNKMFSWVLNRAVFQEQGIEVRLEYSNFQSPSLGLIKYGDSPAEKIACALPSNGAK